jgi:hypothetical protein
MKVLVCGGRDFDAREIIWQALQHLHDVRGPITALIEGGARGVDQHAYAWAKWRGLHNQTYPADWNTHGRAAGPIRNAQMLRDGNPDLVVAFPGGRGTASMVALARKAGVEVIEVTEPLLDPRG